MSTEKNESSTDDPNIILLRKTIFIFGISSFVGSSLAEFLKKDFRVIGTYSHNPVEIEGVLTFPMDISNRDAIQLVLFTFKPDITLYCIGLSSLQDCDENEKLGDALNTTGLFSVAGFTERYKSKLIYFSSAYVFTGEKVMFLEDDTPLANTTYGKTQGSAEFFIQKSCLNYLIFRCPKMYGRSLVPGQKNWFEVIQDQLFKGESINVDNNIKTGFLDVIYLAMLLKLSIQKNATNRLFQVSSSDIMSLYEFSKEYAEVFGDKADLVGKTTWSFPEIQSSIIQSSAAEGLEYRMDTENVESYLNVKLPSIRESLELTKERLGGSSAKKMSVKKSGQIAFI